jgi:photosystem II stability/assembly factor-like uncharacterized protein
MIPSMRRLIIASLCFTLTGWIGCTPRTVAEKRQEAKLTRSRVGDVPRGDGGQYKISFINERDGWLAQGRHVWRTTDGGTTWSFVFAANQPTGPTSLAAQYAPSGFEFVNSKIGFLQLGDVLHRTEDGGRTWITLSNLPIQEPKGFARCFKFLSDGRHGWIGGGIYSPISVEQARTLPKAGLAEHDRFFAIQGTIWATVDGGKIWHRQSLPRTIGSIESLYFYDDRHGLALGLSQVFYTDDGGQRWREADFSGKCVSAKQWRETADERYPISVFVISNLGLLAFKDGYIARSTNGGMSWCDFRQPGDITFERSYDFLSSLHFVDSEHAFGLVRYQIYQTSDGGRTWAKHPLDARIDAMAPADDRFVFAVGADGLFRISP